MVSTPIQSINIPLNKPKTPIPISTNKNIFGKFSNLIGQGTKTENRGVYIWGGVGRGKSMLMDLFFENVNFKSKKRTHFHNFMAETHDLIHKLRKDERIKNIPDHAAELISRDSKLLCFDEMELRDIADAMVLNRLFSGLWNRGVIIVATSNRPPEKLYEKKPGEALKLAVKRMLPTGVLGRKQLTKLKIYSGSDHPHSAQNPKVIDLSKLNSKNIARI